MGGFDLRGLSRPVVVAPMAGGPSTPELAAAGSNAGGLGFLAAGYLTAEALANRIAAARRLTTQPLGVNLFAPQPSVGTAAGIAAYADELAGEARRRQSLSLLLAEVLVAVDVPVVAAGGLITADDVAGVLAAGAAAAQLGTAFLLADEAGSGPVHRAAPVAEIIAGLTSS